jgi:hypothetical protein
MPAYHIIYPNGDTTKLQVLTQTYANVDELRNYSRASDKAFQDFDKAERYACSLAAYHEKTYVPVPEDRFLDDSFMTD